MLKDDSEWMMYRFSRKRSNTIIHPFQVIRILRITDTRINFAADETTRFSGTTYVHNHPLRRIAKPKNSTNDLKRFI